MPITANITDQLILIAVDHSSQALNAIKYYLDHLHRDKNRLMLVHCIELPGINDARECHMSPGVLASLWREEEAKSKILEDKLKLLLSDKNIPARLRNVRGKPGEALCQIAIDEKAALIVLGCRGIGALRRTILGSVSDYVVLHAYCPVIICRDSTDNEQQLVSKRRSRHNSEMTPLTSSKNCNPSPLGSKGEGIIAQQWRKKFASGSLSFQQSSSASEEYKQELRKLEKMVELNPQFD